MHYLLTKEKLLHLQVEIKNAQTLKCFFFYWFTRITEAKVNGKLLNKSQKQQFCEAEVKGGNIYSSVKST